MGKRPIIFVAGVLLGAVLGAAICYVVTRERLAVPEGATLYGSARSTVAHRTSCRHGRKIALRNRVWFRSIEEAGTVGYRPCRVCRPRAAAQVTPPSSP